MDYASAVERLTYHCGSNPNIDDPRWAGGFLQSLRPYRGHLDAVAMDDVLNCVDAVAEHIKTADVLDRAVVNSLWGINHWARSWALHPDGMLRRNGLISDADRQTLSDWLDDLAERIAFMLDGGTDPKYDA
ncbi:hypothetical protein [Neorhodopirellula lusitana]|uniref:hypothetical protein n=1 Tax=Neorhodopirellula lusitana TaxID=445327 RepID=UPI00384E53C5